jgi:hypothetical protein
MLGTIEKRFALREVTAVCGLILLASAIVSAQAAAPASYRATSEARATLVLMSSSMPTPKPGIDPGCKVVFDATDKLLTVPNHAYMTHKDASGKANSSEIISIDGARYLMVGGKWSKSPRTLQQAKQAEEEKMKNPQLKMSCKHLGDDTVNGEAVGVYTSHEETEDVSSDAKFWISKGKGLILKEELQPEAGDVEHQLNLRYEYSNVHAPM